MPLGPQQATKHVGSREYCDNLSGTDQVVARMRTSIMGALHRAIFSLMAKLDKDLQSLVHVNILTIAMCII